MISNYKIKSSYFHLYHYADDTIIITQSHNNLDSLTNNMENEPSKCKMILFE